FALPVIVVRRENEPAAKYGGLAHPDVHRDESPLAETDEEGSFELHSPTLFLAEGRERLVDDGLCGHPVVGPAARPVPTVFGAARAEHPAHLTGYLSPLGTVALGNGASPVKEENDRLLPSLERRIEIGRGRPRYFESLRQSISIAVFGG